LAHAARHRNGKLPARTHIAKKCSYERRPRLHSWKPSSQNRRYASRGPVEGQWPENNQDNGFPRRGHCFQKLLLVSRQTEMGSGSYLG
jgi:hypothetical protein